MNGYPRPINLPIMDGVIAYWSLLAIKALLWCLEILTDLLFGYTLTGGSRSDRRKAWLHHECSAQVVSIVCRAHYMDPIPHSLKNFLYVHEEYVDPRYVLEKENVTLFTMDTTHVYFCVTTPEVDIYDTKKFPFVFISHYYEAKKLVILPIASFKRLGDELGDPKVPVCLINMTARCGSTLISQMMMRVPKVRSMSEPWAMMQLNNHFRKRWFNWDETRKLIQTCMRLHCKVEPGSDVERIVIKMTPSTSPMFVALAELFPKFDLVFNTRHPKPSILSLHKLATHTTSRSLYLSLKLYLTEFLYNFFPLPYTDEYAAMLESIVRLLARYSKEDAYALVWGSVFLTYTEARHIYKHVVLYENLVSSPEEEAKKLFTVLNMSHKHVPAALEALEQDSQQGTFGRREEKDPLPPEMWKRLDEVFSSLNLRLSIDMSLEDFKAAVFKNNVDGAQTKIPVVIEA